MSVFDQWGCGQMYGRAVGWEIGPRTSQTGCLVAFGVNSGFWVWGRQEIDDKMTSQP